MSVDSLSQDREYNIDRKISDNFEYLLRPLLPFVNIILLE